MSLLGICTLQLEPGEIVWNSSLFHLKFGRSRTLWTGLNTRTRVLGLLVAEGRDSVRVPPNILALSWDKKALFDSRRGLAGRIVIDPVGEVECSWRCYRSILQRSEGSDVHRTQLGN